MGPLPKRRWSTRRQGQKRATHSLKKISLTVCPNCREPKLPHCACLKCGYYNGKQVIKIKEAKKKVNENSK
ncbi:MAG: 50S ribosomal protein L32 [Microgenomates group bacterium ADurb.Bin219]|nr:MAG: 50S ribosomal protein L32 [Microgenomates group bacterium ADurb.Bin219]HNP89444.1 50S ribosomal protein L32 [Candidatus Woesebacteria bacterium]